MIKELFSAPEMAQVGHRPAADLLCTLRLARRVYRGVPSYRLGTLVSHLPLDAEAGVHRALADAVAAARLLLRMREDLMARYGLPAVPAELLHALQGTPPCQAEDWLRRTAAAEVARWPGDAGL
jgi:DNA polymerase-3 subunit epsilon